MTRRSPVFTLHILLSTSLLYFLLGLTRVEATDLYSWTDEFGVTHYSTSPTDQRAQRTLPKAIARENIDSRIVDLQRSAERDCDAHGGVNCALGSDADGSVVCQDGSRDAMLPFSGHCIDARLKAEEVIFTDVSGSNWTLSSVLAKHPGRLSDDAAHFDPVGVHVSVRNFSAVGAKDVVVQIGIPLRTASYLDIPHGRDEEIILFGAGRKEVGSYGSEEYTFRLTPEAKDELLIALKRRGKSSVRVRIACSNCHSDQLD